MVERKPLVLINGDVEELPDGDSVPGGGGAATGSLQAFTAFKSGTQLSTGTFADLTGWATPVIDDAAFSFNTTTGVLTFQEDGRYLIFINVEGTTTGTSRVQLEIQLMEDTGSGFTAQPKARWRNYTIRNTTQNEGGVTGSYVADYNNGDNIKFQILDIGTAYNVLTDDARIFVVKLEGAKGDTGAAGADGADGDIAANNIEITGSTTLSNATHAGANLIVNSASAVTITVDGTLPVDFQCTVVRWGAGTVTLDFTADDVNGTTTPDVTIDTQRKGAYITQWQEGDWYADGNITVT